MDFKPCDRLNYKVLEELDNPIPIVQISYQESNEIRMDRSRQNGRICGPHLTDCLESGEEAACPSRKSPKAGNNRGLRRWRPRPRPRLDLLRPTMGLRRSGASLLRSIALPNLKRKTLGSFSSVYDTYLSTKVLPFPFFFSYSIFCLFLFWNGW